MESVSTVLGEFHAVVFEGLSGNLMEFEELPPEFFKHWGRSLGKLHNAARGFQTASRPNWQEHLKMVQYTLPASDADALNVLKATQKQLGALAQNKVNFGLIHFDYELDNIVWEGEIAGILDFDDCAYYWFAADIAFALRDLFDDNSANFDPLNGSFLKFIQGYRLERVIAQAEVDSIPLFMNLHNLVTYAKMLRTLDETPGKSEPAWLMELRGKLVRKIDAYHRNFARLVQIL
jgi:Ser/Thr protein kinase RdoA (MazF antagonist)